VFLRPRRTRELFAGPALAQAAMADAHKCFHDGVEILMQAGPCEEAGESGRSPRVLCPDLSFLRASAIKTLAEWLCLRPSHRYRMTSQ
jgi:hypothetical protein